MGGGGQPRSQTFSVHTCLMGGGVSGVLDIVQRLVVFFMAPLRLVSYVRFIIGSIGIGIGISICICISIGISTCICISISIGIGINISIGIFISKGISIGSISIGISIIISTNIGKGISIGIGIKMVCLTSLTAPYNDV